MRYRDVNDLGDVSRDVAVVIDFIGQEEYHDSLEAIGRSLNAKGFVTPFDDAMFALELDLLNLERLRARCSGKFESLPSKCHEGVDFLVGFLNKTVSTACSSYASAVYDSPSCRFGQAVIFSGVRKKPPTAQTVGYRHG